MKKLWWRIRGKVVGFIREQSSPKMLWGYESVPDGVFRPRTRVSNTAFFYHKEKISLADNVFVWHYSIIDGTGGLEIGEGSQIGAWVGIFTHSSHLAIRIYGDMYQKVCEHEKECYPIQPVKIGRFVFVGAKAIVLPGVTIGDGVLISTGSVVRDDVEDFAIVAGNPAQKVGDTRKMDRKVWDERFGEHYYQNYLRIPHEKWWNFS